ncbi:MAG: MotA/TolQ/ExbB proton channel family protein [Bdellovibrionales bacterium]|nr:MotA/TolQ/ExbB proton channel family protein [Bdellovibrionales bacterium]
MIEHLNKCEAVTGLAKPFCEGGVVMYIIALIGLLTLFLIIERALSLKKLLVNKDSLSENLFNMILRGDVQQAIAYCDSKPAPMTNTMKAGLVQVLNKRPDEEIQVAMDASVLRETPKIEGWTSFLAVFGNLSVLVGLLGTIIGLITSFSGVSQADAATKAALLSKGISEALNCTAFGLLVSIIAIFAYGIFQTIIGRALTELSENTMNLMNVVVSNRDKIEKQSS